MKRIPFNKLIEDSYCISKITDKFFVYYQFCFINNYRLFNQYEYVNKFPVDFTDQQIKTLERSIVWVNY